MVAHTQDIKATEVKLSDELEELIDHDIEESEREIANGEYLEAHEARELMKNEFGFV